MQIKPQIQYLNSVTREEGKTNYTITIIILRKQYQGMFMTLIIQFMKKIIIILE